MMGQINDQGRPWAAQDFALSGGGFETGLINTNVCSSAYGNANTDTVRTPLYLVPGGTPLSY